MQKIYISPSAKRGAGYPNRYFLILKEKLAKHYEVLEADNRECLMQGTAMLRNSLKADIFLLSFVETIAFQKLALLQCILAAASLKIMKLRGKKVAYIFHNIHPHKGETSLSLWLTRMQFKQSCLVLTHSEAAAQYARERISELGGDPSKVIYRCHPVADAAKPAEGCIKGDSILIWGDILPYKGVVEFLNTGSIRNAGLSLRILGRCKDQGLLSKLEEAIRSYDGMPSKVVFDNRRADFEEIAQAIGESRYVLFPYLPESVSGSGALMDTIGMGGTPVGPAVGAFLDLSKQGECIVYNSSEELAEILCRESRTDESGREDFVTNNTWDAFADRIFTFLSSLS